MKFNELQTPRQKSTRRPGRGISAGRGKTAGRGTKGQGARKSSNVRPGFEGGQMPLYMRVPKLRGFKSHHPKPLTVYTGQLDSVKKAGINSVVLFEAGLVADAHSPIKLLLKGEVTTKKDVQLQAASAGAIAAIEKAGGSFKRVERLARVAAQKDESK